MLRKFECNFKLELKNTRAYLAVDFCANLYSSAKKIKI